MHSMLFTAYQETRVGHHETIMMAGNECNMKFIFWLKITYWCKKILIKSNPIALINLSRYFHF